MFIYFGVMIILFHRNHGHESFNEDLVTYNDLSMFSCRSILEV